MTLIELVNVRNPAIRAKQVAKSTALKPQSIQAPFGAGRQQPVGHQNEQNVVPTRTLAAGRQPLAPKLPQVQLFPNLQRQPAGPPLPRAAQAQLRQSQLDDRGARQQTVTTILGEQRESSWPIGVLVQNLNRPAPSTLLRSIDLAEIQDVPLTHLAAGNTLVLDNAPVAVLLVETCAADDMKPTGWE